MVRKTDIPGLWDYLQCYGWNWKLVKCFGGGPFHAFSLYKAITQKNPSISGLTDWLTHFNTTFATIWPFRLRLELIRDPKYDQKVLEEIISSIQLGY